MPRTPLNMTGHGATRHHPQTIELSLNTHACAGLRSRRHFVRGLGAARRRVRGGRALHAPHGEHVLACVERACWVRVSVRCSIAQFSGGRAAHARRTVGPACVCTPHTRTVCRADVRDAGGPGPEPAARPGSCGGCSGGVNRTRRRQPNRQQGAWARGRWRACGGGGGRGANGARGC